MDPLVDFMEPLHNINRFLNILSLYDETSGDIGELNIVIIGAMSISQTYMTLREVNRSFEMNVLVVAN